MDQLYIRTDVIMSLAASFPEFALGRAFYWKTDRVEPGRYYVGLWAETSDKRYRSEYSPIKLLSTLFQNGWPVRFATTSDPVQVKPERWVAELQSRDAVDGHVAEHVDRAIERGLTQLEGVHGIPDRAPGNRGLAVLVLRWCGPAICTSVRPSLRSGLQIPPNDGTPPD